MKSGIVRNENVPWAERFQLTKIHHGHVLRKRTGGRRHGAGMIVVWNPVIGDENLNGVAVGRASSQRSESGKVIACECETLWSGEHFSSRDKSVRRLVVISV